MLSAVHGDSDAGVALAGGYYGTSEPKDSCHGTPGYFPDSGVAALSHKGQTAAVGFYPTHALHGSDEGGSCAVRKMVALALLHPNFPVRSVMAPGTFHPPHDVRMELCFRSPFQICRSRSSSALNGLLQSQGIRRSPVTLRLLPTAAST